MTDTDAGGQQDVVESSTTTMRQSGVVLLKQPVFWIGFLVLLAGIQTGYYNLGIVLGIPTIALGMKHGVDDVKTEVSEA